MILKAWLKDRLLNPQFESLFNSSLFATRWEDDKEMEGVWQEFANDGNGAGIFTQSTSTAGVKPGLYLPSSYPNPKTIPQGRPYPGCYHPQAGMGLHPYRLNPARNMSKTHEMWTRVRNTQHPITKPFTPPDYIAPQIEPLAGCRSPRGRQTAVGGLYSTLLIRACLYLPRWRCSQHFKNLVFSLYLDWLNAEGASSLGKHNFLGAITLVCLNLPPTQCYKVQNMFLFAIIPGPTEPSLEQFNHVLRPLVEELKLFWNPSHFFSKRLHDPHHNLPIDCRPSRPLENSWLWRTPSNPLLLFLHVEKEQY
jgi:hypothetical protein